MTNREYKRLYYKSRVEFDHLTRETMKKVKKVYIKAADDVSKKVIAAELAGQSELTIASKSVIETELRRGAAIIAESIQEETPELIKKSYSRLYAIDETYIMDAVKNAGIARISVGQIRAFGAMVNHQLNLSLISRIWEDGYTFSDRCWQAGANYQDAIKNVLQGGLVQGRDPVKIAKDITQYVKKGKPALAGRWGRLKPGTKEYMKRIPKKVDYRALRLVRSELNMSLQEAATRQGELNPAATKFYDWFLEPGERPANDPCPDIAKASPYQAKNLPSYPHPNCQCIIAPVLRKEKEFISDLQKWATGEPVKYLDEWEKKAEIAGLTV